MILLYTRLLMRNTFVVVNASNIDKDWNHISKYNTFGAKMTNASDDMSLIAIQGLKATEILQKITDTQLADIPLLQLHYWCCSRCSGCNYFQYRLYRIRRF